MSESMSTSRRGLKRSIRELGKSLGSTPAAVAANLAALEVHGSPGNAGECAVARYMRAVIGTEMSVSDLSVLDRHVQVSRNNRNLPLMVRLPKPVIRFIRAFDEGCYPELLDQPRRRNAYR